MNLYLALLTTISLAAVVSAPKILAAPEVPIELKDIRLLCKVPSTSGKKKVPCKKTLIQMAMPFTGSGKHAGKVIELKGKSTIRLTGYCPKGFRYVATNGEIGYRCRVDGTINTSRYYKMNGMKALFATGMLPPVEKHEIQMWTPEDADAARRLRDICRAPGGNANWRCRTIIPGYGTYNSVTGQFIY